MGSKQGRRPKKPSGKKSATKPTDSAEEVPVFQVATDWGSKKDIYYESADSGTGSDEEHLVEEAIEEEKQHLSKMKDQDFKLLNTIQQSTQPLDVPASLEQLENEIKQKEEADLAEKVRSVIKDVGDASQELQHPFEDTPSDSLRQRLLYSLFTNGSYYLYLVSSGYKRVQHPSLTQMEEIKRIIEGEPEEEELPVQQAEEEEEVAAEEESAEEEVSSEEEEAKEEKPEKHIPVHLREVQQGDYRPVSDTILHNRVLAPNTPEWRRNPRTQKRKRFARAMHVYNAVHKTQHMPSDGVYKGERSGIRPGKVGSTNMASAH